MKTKRLLNDCFLHDRDRLSHADAIALLKSRVLPIINEETIPLDQACGRIAAATMKAERAIPAHPNSAVDGYAFKAGCRKLDHDLELPVCGRAAAGHPLADRPDPGTAVRIFTGAIMPEGLDTVVMQEDVELADRQGTPVVHIPKGLKGGANVRPEGDDVCPGYKLISKSQMIRPQDLAALSAMGVANLSCYRPLRIGVLSTGDEVIRAGARALKPGEVFDANAPMLCALAKLAGADVTDLGIWPDDPSTISKRLTQAAELFDVILTSGGASRGEEDHMLSVLGELGTCHMWQLAIKPGRPLMFGQIGDAVMVGLPGNPVAVFVCFLMYVFPLLRRLGGAAWPEPRRFHLRAAFEVPKRKMGRREFWRGHMIESESGLKVEKFAKDGSGIISGLCASNGLIDVPEDVKAVARDDLVAFIPFSQFGILDQ